ncbi:MAG TPA: nuclear transport factor 2 family protein [Polyangiaceae bacterium]|nr:nuclear transport factor 2 family protein [Polyangiaceae bacterium]
MSALAQRLQEYYETFPVERERALERLGELFAADVHFRDPFRDTQGIERLRELFVRMFKQYRQVEFTGFSRDGDDDRFVLTYDMHLRMAVGPTFVTHMASVVRGREGRVVELIDYYDFPSALASPLPLLGTLYRKAVNLLFL